MRKQSDPKPFVSMFWTMLDPKKHAWQAGDFTARISDAGQKLHDTTRQARREDTRIDDTKTRHGHRGIRHKDTTREHGAKTRHEDATPRYDITENKTHL